MYANNVFLAGNLTKDPEVNYYDQDKKVTKFSIAINRRYLDVKGEKKEEVCYCDITVFDSQADSCAKYLQKGDNVYLEGVLQTRSWETDTGERKSKLCVKGTRVQFIKCKKWLTEKKEEATE